MLTWQAVAIDLGVLIAVTLLAIFRVVPPEAAIAVLGTMAGSRATLRAPDPSASKSDGLKLPPSAAVVVLVGLASLMTSIMGVKKS